jgi:hypothetical protein
MNDKTVIVRVSRRKKNMILEFLGIQDYELKNEISSFTVSV